MNLDEINDHVNSPKYKADDAQAHEWLDHVMPLAVRSINPQLTAQQRLDAAEAYSRHALALGPQAMYVALVMSMRASAELGVHLYGHHRCECADLG